MKEEILQTSLKQFLKHGIREMSIQKLVEPLGISTKTVYKYFKNKEELLEEALDLFHAQHRNTWTKISSDQSAVIVFYDIWRIAIDVEYKVNKVFFEDLHYYYPELEKKKEGALTQEYTQQFLQVIYKGMDEGVFQPNINPEIIFLAISVLFQSIVRQGSFKRFRASADEVFSNTIALYIRGFCTKKGLEELDSHLEVLKMRSDVKSSDGKVASKL